MKIIYCFALLLLPCTQLFSQARLFEIANCNGELQTISYGDQLSDVTWCMSGHMKFTEARRLKFGNGSKVNLDSLESKAKEFRKNIPASYWNDAASVTRLDTKPNEDGKIWFDRIFAIEEKGNLKVYGAFKVVFEGTDPAIERIAPKIQELKIITGKKELQQYNAVIKKLKEANKK